MKFFACLILIIACLQANPTLQDIQNASYHLPAGYEGEGRGEVAAIDKSHNVKFTDGRGSDKKFVYWVYGAKGTPDFTQTTKETEYKWKQLPLVEEDKSVYAVSDSIAAVLVVQSNIEHGGREEYLMLLIESQGELKHVYLKTNYGGRYTKSMSIRSGKLFITNMNWVSEETNDWDLAELLNSSRKGRSVEAPYPSAPPKIYAPRTYPTYESNGVMRKFFANMNYSNIVKLPHVPFFLQGPMVAVGSLPAGGSLKLIPEGQYVGEITQNQVVLSDMKYPILEVYSATGQDGVPNMFLYCRGVTLGFNDAQEIVKNKIGGRLWVKVVHQGSGEYYQLIIK